MLELVLIGVLSFLAGFLLRDITTDLLQYYMMGFRHGIMKDETIVDKLDEKDLEQYGIERIKK